MNIGNVQTFVLEHALVVHRSLMASYLVAIAVVVWGGDLRILALGYFVLAFWFHTWLRSETTKLREADRHNEGP